MGANVRYWPTVAPIVRSQMHHWEKRARSIPNPILQAIALKKLRDERFNAELATTLATFAPRSQRNLVAEATLALQVMYDYLDGLIEQPVPNPECNSQQLCQALADAVNQNAEPISDYYYHYPQSDDNGYLQELVATVRNALSRLPSRDAISEIAQRTTDWCAQAQARTHTHTHSLTSGVQAWAVREAANTTLEWREFLAGALTSVIAVYALFAAAADRRTTHEQAKQIDEVYLAIAVLSTLLDSLIDYEQDIEDTGRPGYIRHYEDSDLLKRRLIATVRYAVTQVRSLPNAAQHTMVLIGVVAYYTSAPSASSEHAKPIVESINRELRPLITPTLAIMRTWRVAKGHSADRTPLQSEPESEIS